MAAGSHALVLAALVGGASLAEAAPALEVDEEETVVVRTSTPTSSAAPVSAAAPGPVSTATAPAARGEFMLPGGIKLSLHGFIHVDAIVWDQASEDELDPSTRRPLNQSRFLIRQARVRADLERDFVAGGLELDGNTIDGPAARIISADVSLRWPWDPELLSLTAGLFKVPFGLAAAERIKTRMFLDAPGFVRAYFPGEYDVGVKLQGGWRFLRYVVAAMNGNPVGEPRFGGRDPTQAKDVLGRFGVDVAPLDGFRVQAGMSALFGRGLHAGTPTTKDELVWRDLNEDGIVQLTELQVLAGAAATPSVQFDRAALGMDLRVIFTVPVLGEVVSFAELTWAKNLDRGLFVADPVAAARDLRELGWAVGAYAEVGTLGRVGVRYDRYDPDGDATDPQGAVRVPSDASISTLSAVAEWRWSELGSVILGYDHNDNALGRRADGTPTRLPSDVLTVRAALGF